MSVEDALAFDVASEQRWSFDADGDHFRLASEARRIELAHLFDPFTAVEAAGIDPLPHQIEAVYERLLPMQPLRFLLADDPGAAKTIMAGLYIRELVLRGDLERCLIVAPGSLVRSGRKSCGTSSVSASTSCLVTWSRHRRSPARVGVVSTLWPGVTAARGAVSSQDMGARHARDPDMGASCGSRRPCSARPRGGGSRNRSRAISDRHRRGEENSVHDLGASSLGGSG